MNLRLLCALLFSAAVFAQQPVDFGKSTLIGKVKQTETRVYIADSKEGKISKGAGLNKGIYNAGLLLQSQELKRSGAAQYFMDFFSETLPSVVTYDAKGLVKERRILEDDASLLISYAYNAKHQLVKEELYYLSKLMMKHDYTYRPDGQLATELFGGYGREEIKCTFMYNAEGRLNEESYSLAASGTPTVKVMYSYNKQQQLTRLSAQATYSYTNGRLSEVIYDRPSGISPNTYVMNSTFEYDADGRLRKEEVHFNNQENNAVINTFDEKGRVIAQFTASNKMQQRFVYTDDEKGNWVELVYYQNDVPIALVERKITYE